MKIRILWIGKTKEGYLSEAIDRYLKLLSPLARVSIIEVKEQKSRTREGSLLEEGRKILKQTQKYTLLDQSGREFTSSGFARFLQEKGGGADFLDFLIGGPFGVSDEIRDRAEGTIALSRMTFTHEMIRVFLLEQLFRAMTIIHGREYHH